MNRKIVSSLMVAASLFAVTVPASGPAFAETAAQSAEGQRPLWGDTHLHTTYSFDAYMFGNLTVDPDAAYRFARGEPVVHPRSGGRVQLERPLDFLVVSDHAELMGISRAIGQDDKRLTSAPAGQSLAALLKAGRFREAFNAIVALLFSPAGRKLVENPEIGKEAWSDIVASADRNNRPGTFSAIVGWEWTSTHAGASGFGLDAGDDVIRQRRVQKSLFILEAGSKAEPTVPELKAY